MSLKFVSLLSFLFVMGCSSAGRSPASANLKYGCDISPEYKNFLNKKVEVGDVLVFRTAKGKSFRRLKGNHRKYKYRRPMFGRTRFENFDKRMLVGRAKNAGKSNLVTVDTQVKRGRYMDIPDGTKFTVESVRSEEVQKPRGYVGEAYFVKYLYTVKSSSGKVYMMSCETGDGIGSLRGVVDGKPRRVKKAFSQCLYSHFQFDGFEKNKTYQRFELEGKKSPSYARQCLELKPQKINYEPKEPAAEQPVEI